MEAKETEERPAPQDETPEPEPPPAPKWRPAAEPTCCGAGCDDCPF